jgi:hypothetical protein
MWALDNQTPFAAERGWVRDRTGAEVWIVAVKATLLIGPDGSKKLAPTPEPVSLAPKFRGDPAKSSLLYDTDLVPVKSATDILLHGHAYAPKGTAAKQVDVSMRVGAVRKALRVFGDRYWRVGMLGLKLSDPDQFVKMPLVYERAHGGADPAMPDKGWSVRNPVGLGYALKAEHLAGRRAPNVEDPAEPITSPKQQPKLAGFGPIAPHWEARARYGGTYDKKWEEERQPLLPVDFDDRFYQCAPQDQQVPGFLQGGETVELYNLTPSGSLRFTLPRVILGFETSFGRETVRHRAQLHSVILEPDFPRIQMIWQTSLACHSKVLKLKVTTIRRKKVMHWTRPRRARVRA